MKTNKTLRRFAAAVLAGTMMLAMSTSAFAADVTEPSDNGGIQVTLTKKVTAEKNVKAPNTTFTFKIANGNGTTDNEVVIYSGITDGAFFGEGANIITFTPTDSTLEKTTAINFDVERFEKPGVYRYVITETVGAYDGITYDSSQYYMDVYVVNGDKGLKIDAVTTTKTNETEKSDLVFENKYATNNLTLEKVVAGNQANMNQKFKFEITVNGANGEQYATSNSNVVLTSKETTTVELGNNETITVYGLSAGDTYTIVEKDNSDDGYETKINGADETDKLTATGNVADEDDTVVYTNTKEVTTPTGIITNVLPYVLMVAVAAALVVVFLRKREYDK